MDMDAKFEAVLVEQKDGVLWAKMTEGAHLDEELIRLFWEAKRDPQVRVVVLTGSQERAFCVGAGGANAPQDDAGRNAYWVNGMRVMRDLVLTALDCDKPVIGRINGHAVGKGCSIALCCDITVAVEDAKIGDTHVKVGLAAGDGGSLLWPHLVGMARAKRFLFTGDLLTGREAEAIGLVTEAVPRSRLDERTGYWVDRMLQAAPAAITLTKRALNSAIRQQAAIHMDMSLGMETLSFLTEDYREGIAALTGKRDAKFVGR
jgi:enoyl-CoA hydratase